MLFYAGMSLKAEMQWILNKDINGGIFDSEGINGGIFDSDGTSSLQGGTNLKVGKISRFWAQTKR